MKNYSYISELKLSANPCIKISKWQDLPEHSGDNGCTVCNPLLKLSCESHYHNCPSCYMNVPCSMYCTIASDLEDSGKEFGSPCLCEECEKEKAKQEKYKNKEFWDRYNGFIK